jgi:arylsulfatase A-like enzyme
VKWARADRPNVLFIVADTTRADALGLGSTGGAAPELAAAAGQGRVYRRATSPSPWTPPAHASMFTGLAPSEHGIWGPNLLDEHGWPQSGVLRGLVLERWLPAVLAERGYRTLGISANAWVSEYLGFDYGFDRFLTIRANPSGRRGRSGAENIARMLPDRLAQPLRRRRVRGRVRRRGQDWGAERAVTAIPDLIAPDGRPFFAFINLMEAHFPYNPPADLAGFSAEEERRAIEVLIRYRSPLAFDSAGRITKRELPPEDAAMLRRLYSGEVSYLDGRLGELLDRLSDAGRLDDTVVLIVADHGEHLGEHGKVGHVDSVHEELLHVPLLVLGPADLVGRGVEDARVSTQSLYQAVLDWTSGEPRALSSLSPVVTEYEGVWHHAGSVRRMGRGGGDAASKATVWVVYQDDWKLVHCSDGAERLYDLRSDPSETREGIDDARRDKMRAELTEVLAGRRPSALSDTGGSGQRDPEVESELRALGYL